MRKIFTSLAILVGLSSCSTETVYSSRSIDGSMGYHVYALHFTSENHQYISFVINNNFAGVDHDPECWCMVDPD